MNMRTEGRENWKEETLDFTMHRSRSKEKTS
ncbi:hypothetical protein BH09VER1_BH09VER1_24380 [soil metagenome]